MSSGSPRLLVIPNADLQMENQEPGGYLEQLLTFRKKKSTLEKAKSVLRGIGRTMKKVSNTIIACRNYIPRILLLILVGQCRIIVCIIIIMLVRSFGKIILIMAFIS